jgi:hypothetical protein
VANRKKWKEIFRQAKSPQWAVVSMEEEEEEDAEDPGKDGKRKQKEIFKCWE